VRLDEAIKFTLPYIKHLSHDSRLYDREDIIQEGMIAVWLTLSKLDEEMAHKAKMSYLRTAISWRVNNFINKNLVHMKIGRNTLWKLRKQGIDVIELYRHLPCADMDGVKSTDLGPYAQACFNEGLRRVKKREDIVKYI
jgi:hypothetical protein